MGLTVRLVPSISGGSAEFLGRAGRNIATGQRGAVGFARLPGGCARRALEMDCSDLVRRYFDAMAANDFDPWRASLTVQIAPDGA